MKIFSIYTITNALNGKRYIGFTSQKPLARYRRHLHGQSGCKAIRRAIRKYGEQNLVMEVIYQSLDHHHTLAVMEPHFIAEFGTFGDGGYNLTAGGEGTLGRKRPPEEVERMALRARGRKASAETRRRMSESQKRRPKGVAHPNFGKKRSAESIRKQVVASVGKSRSLETRLKQSEAQKGERGSGFGKRGGLHHQARKYHLEKTDGTIIEFVGLAEFCRLNPPYSPSSLSMMASGQKQTYRDIKRVTLLGNVTAAKGKNWIGQQTQNDRGVA